MVPMFGGSPAGTAVGDSVVTVTINNKKYTVDVLKDEGLGQMATLNEFIRQRTPFRGTKRSCGEGGCGACVVMLTGADDKPRAINSCLRPLASCNGMAVTTTEGIGSAADGYNPVQTTLAKEGGSQCGYCSPGFTMSMYSLLCEKKSGSVTKQEVEEALHGNICRCTGFRPILQADHTFATEQAEGRAKCMRAEPSPPRRCTPVVAQSDAVTWIDVTTEAQLAATLTQYSKASPAPKDLMLANGRTSQGIWKTRQPDVILNIAPIQELRYTRTTSTGFEIGAGTPITDVLEYVEYLSGAGAAHMPQFADHLRKVASTPIRNAASIGGNVMLTHLHQARGDNFAYSDVTTNLYALGATLQIKDPDASQPVDVSFDDFYAKDMTYSYLVSLTIPLATEGEVYKSFRIAARTAMSHPFAVSGFRCTVRNGVIASDAPVAVVVGGCDLHPTQKVKTAAALRGIQVTSIDSFRQVAGVLAGETDPTPEEGRVDFRKSVTINFLYKFFLTLQPNLPSNLQSGAQSWFVRKPLEGAQTFDTDPDVYPVTKPEPKINALKQVAGEALYSGDIADPANLLHLAPVLATKLGKYTIDTSAAEKLEGWEGLFTESDMSGLGNHLVIMGPLLAVKETEYIGQCIALVMANSPQHATECARAVSVNYTSTKAPLVDIDEAITKKSFFTTLVDGHLVHGDVAKAFSEAEHVEDVVFRLGEQYHFYMESQTAMTTLKSDGIGLKVYSATQFQSVLATEVAATVEGLAAADITVETTRCGGAYGGKIYNSLRPACWSAVVAHKEKRAAKIVMEIDDNFANMGQRPPWRFDVKVGYGSNGKITAVYGTFYVRVGHSELDAVSNSANDATKDCDNCYNIPNWNVTVRYVKTNTPPSTACRGPGFVPAVFFAETLIAHVAGATGLTEDAVRAANYYKTNELTPNGSKLTHWQNFQTILSRLTTSSQYTDRIKAVQAYNAANMWTKRGLSLTPVKYPFSYSKVVEFEVALQGHSDGSMMVWSSGIEVGQGLLTKVAEVVSLTLGMPEELIRLQPSDTSVAALLGSITGGSTTSELCCLAAENASAKLNRELAAVRKSLPATATWQEISAQAFKMGINMKVHGTSDPNQPAKVTPTQYQSYCAGIHEVEVDCLTGEVSLLRSDILYDAGRAINPLIDVGQIEGGYLMGVGYALTEEMGRDSTTGLCKVNNTWEYHVPSAADIPQVWNTGLLKGIPNPDGAMKTKATAEPPVCLGTGIVHSVSAAVSAFNSKAHVQTALPFSVDLRQQACSAQAVSHYTFA
eukprot:TRINITY_DN12144_c0_g2_i2.p2 TRINITY_DN12144_c0_g2~~TRINITY_DN12144_c0_g2_i2.p2  ORF type:complete len:1308 (+),score=591.63 TRINITY_DN12144_c0_g2_i2:88-3924(+)